MVLQYFYDLRSQPCRAVYYLLKSASVDFEAHQLDLPQGDQHKSSEIHKMNPQHKVPIIKDDDFVLTESVAILRYITAKYNLPEHWYPRNDVRKQARVDEFLNWQHTGLRKPCLELAVTKATHNCNVKKPFEEFREGKPVAMIQMKMAAGPLKKIPLDANKIKELEEKVAKAVKDIDEYFLRQTPFIAGDEVSSADLIGYCELTQLDSIEDTTYKANNNVNQWLGRVEATIEEYKEEATERIQAFKQTFVNA